MGDNKVDNEKLLLLEVLVDDLKISSSRSNLDNNISSNITETCVLFQFLNYPPLVVSESNFIGTLASHSRTETSHVNFKSGKSCYFSLRTPKGPIIPVPFDLKVYAFHKLKEGALPNKLDIGKASINMSSEFSELLRQNADYECDAMPISRNKKGMFEIIDSNGKRVGSLTAFIRLSCFGKLIVTQFSFNKENEKSYLFKGTDINKICQQPANENERRHISEINKTDDLFPSLIKKPGSHDYNKSQRERPSKRRSFDDNLADRKYEDIFSKRPRYDDEYRYTKDHIARSDQNECEFMDFINTQYGCSNFKCCFTSHKQRMPDRQMLRGKRVLGIIGNSYNPRDTSKYSKSADKEMYLEPGEIGIQDDQVIFQLPLKRAGDALSEHDKSIGSTMYYKLTSEVDSKTENPNINVEETKLGGISGLANDNNNVFLLKIGKKINSENKRKLELELKNRSMKDPKPPMMDQDCQYKEGDIPGSKETGGQEKIKKSGTKKGNKINKWLTMNELMFDQLNYKNKKIDM